MTAVQPDYRRWVRYLEERRKEATDPVHTGMIDCFIEHLVSERSGDIERFMRTMVDEPIYRSWGRPRPPGAGPSVREGREVIKALYESMMNRPDGFPQMELEFDRFLFGDDGMVMDGVLHREARGSEFESLREPLPEGGAPDDRFVISRRMALFVSYRDGVMSGEDTYFEATATVTPYAQAQASKP